MSIRDYWRRVFPPSASTVYRAWLNNSEPIFSSFGKNLYLSDFINNAIDRVATEISKIDVKSVVQRGDALSIAHDEITRLFRFKPNPLQTTSDFLSSVEWLRRKNCNAFVYPQYELVQTEIGVFRRYKAFYPLNPSAVYIGVGSDGGPLEVQFNFDDGSQWTLPYYDLIHLRWRRGKNTIVGGGDDYGNPMLRDVLRTVDALDKTIQGLPKSIEASLQIKGVYSIKGTLNKEKMEVSRGFIDEQLANAKSGIIATDIAGDFIPAKIDPAQIQKEAMNFLKSIIQERYGVSAAILSGDYTGEQHSAFYQTAIEDFIVQFEQAFTACLYTPRQQDVGHRVKCYYSKVAYMNTRDKLDLAMLARETGIMTLNQINEMFGVNPFEQGDRRLQSLNYVSIDIADQYQMQQKQKQTQPANPANQGEP